MVRRWSRINEFNFLLKNKKLRFFKKSSKSRVFKLTVSTRRFFKKYTKYRRKAFNRLRHRSNWTIYSNIFKFWSYDYLKTKSFNKKCWVLNKHNFNIIIFNWSCLKNLNTDLFFNLDFFLVNLNFFSSFKFNNNFTFWKNIKNSSICINDALLPNDSDAAPSLLVYNNFFYEIESISFVQEKEEKEFFFFFNNNINFLFQYKINLYKILIYLTFFNF